MSEKQEYKPVEMEEAVGASLFGEEVGTIAGIKSVPMIEVVAPATLPEGYAFEAQVGGRVFTVSVPEGGIEEGQRFTVPANALERTQWSSIPVGAWRDGYFNCCMNGLCHAQCCLTCWCLPCALAQVMQRLNLNWLANPVQGLPLNTFAMIFFLTAAYVVYTVSLCVLNILYLNVSFIVKSINTTNPTDDILTYLIILSFLHHPLAFAFFLYVLIITIKTRCYIRKKYAIRAQDCSESLEDCCCSYWCHCCTVCQMARHTADYDTYSARCCSSTGLGPNAPAIL